MPQDDIRLESPQSVIRAMGGIGHAVVNGWNIEWHLPDGRIIDISIDPHTNLPLIRDFVCTSAEKEEFGAQHINSAGVCNSCDDSRPNHMDQYDH